MNISCETLNEEAEVQNYLDKGNRIVGGNDTTIQAHPYQAYLLLNLGRHNSYCGGSIVSEYYIVSAAHCLPAVRYMQVRIGSTNKNSGGSTYNTTTYTAHPFYDESTFDYDVAIVTISQGMNLDGKYARAIAMVRPGNDPEEGRKMIISGWGRLSEGGSRTETLKAAQVPVVSRETCNNQTYNGITDIMFCAGYEEGGIDSCQGDSGGPAVSTSSGRLTGVTSFGYGCAKPKSPGVYTRIGEMGVRSFILAMTGQ